MISEKILLETIKYLEDIDNNYETILGKELSQKERILADILTVNEEWWELNDEIKRGLQLSFNKEKKANAKKENLEDEAVDVLMSLYLLMKSLGIDNLDAAVQRKISKNNKRWY